MLAAFGAAVPAAAAAEHGAVTGTVRLEPMAQAPVAARYRTRTIAPILDPDPPRAVVYLEHDRAAGPTEAARVAVVEQHGYQFRPSIVGVRKGDRVSFPNRDDEFHNVFSYSPVKRFDLGRYRKDEQVPPVTFDEPGVVRVYCEIHKHMRSLVLVVDTPWFTMTDADGDFEIADVPPGDYRLHAFLPSERVIDARVSVAAGETVRLDLRDGS